MKERTSAALHGRVFGMRCASKDQIEFCMQKPI